MAPALQAPPGLLGPSPGFADVEHAARTDRSHDHLLARAWLELLTQALDTVTRDLDQLATAAVRDDGSPHESQTKPANEEAGSYAARPRH